MITEKIKLKFYSFKGIIEKFPLTVLTIFLATLVSVFSKKINSNIMQFFIYFAVGTFFSETISANKSKKRLIYYLLSGGIAGTFVYLQNIKGTSLNMEKIIFINRLVRWIICYCISVIFLAIYFNYKKSNQSLEEYSVYIFSSVLKTSIIYGVLSLGMLLITSVFVLLILGGIGYTLIIKVEILLFGFYFLPQLVYSFNYQKKATSEFMKVFIKYVLETLVIVAFAIIYIYIAKIIIFRDVPSNQIFRILATLFVIGCPIWTMARKI